MSAYDGVWDPVETLPGELRPLLSDDVGNKPPSYAGSLQLTDARALDIIEELGMFACFRGIQREMLSHVDAYPNTEIYQEIYSQLELVGWDVCTGNGWRSASCDGDFPIDPFDGTMEDIDAVNVTRFGLINTLGLAKEYCDRNDRIAPEDCPWYPVAVLVSTSSLSRLLAPKSAKNRHSDSAPPSN